MLPGLFTQPRIRYFSLLLLLAGTLGVAAYWCFPSLRLTMRAGKISEIPRAQWVDAHRYDQEWFDAARVGRIDILRALYEAHYPIDSRTSADIRQSFFQLTTHSPSHWIICCASAQIPVQATATETLR